MPSKLGPIIAACLYSKFASNAPFRAIPVPVWMQQTDIKSSKILYYMNKKQKQEFDREFTESVTKPLIFVALSIMIFVLTVDSAFQILELL